MEDEYICNAYTTTPPAIKGKLLMYIWVLLIIESANFYWFLKTVQKVKAAALILFQCKFFSTD